jgi:hypothetical protein
MASKLENLPDKFLHKFINPLLEGYNRPIDYISNLLGYNDTERELLKEKFKPTGLLDDAFEDSDFIAALCRENWSALKSSEPLQEPLDRPNLGKYKISMRVSISKYGVEWWRVNLSSYNPSNCKLIAETMHSEGLLEYWEGNMIDEDIHDSDTHDVSIEDVELIKESKNKKPLVEGVSNIIENKSLDDLFKMRLQIEEEILLRLKK